MLSLESNVMPTSNKKPYQSPSFIQFGVKGTQSKENKSSLESELTTGLLS